MTVKIRMEEGQNGLHPKRVSTKPKKAVLGQHYKTDAYDKCRCDSVLSGVRTKLSKTISKLVSSMNKDNNRFTVEIQVLAVSINLLKRCYISGKDILRNNTSLSKQ